MRDKKLGPLDADPNLVPFRKEWEDNTGGMANAIFWLDKHWDKELNAQGNYTDEHGRVIFWNYSWAMKSLLVHLNGSRECWRIDRDKMMHMKDGLEENATIYRPFFRAQSYGMPLYRDGAPDVEWLKTREVVVVKNHHPNRLPLYIGSALSMASERMNNKPLPQFPNVRLGLLLFLVDKPTAKQPMTPEQATAYSALIGQLNTLAGASLPYQSHHIHSYTGLIEKIRDFNALIDPDRGTDTHFRVELNHEMNRLVKEGHPRDAAIVDALNFERSFEESYPKTLQLVRAIHPEYEEAR